VGFILNPGRRAVEHVFTRVPIDITPETQFYLEGKKLNLLSISNGVGTCADLHGINMAVLSFLSPSPDEKPYFKFPISCQGSVLLRRLTDEELEEEKKSKLYTGQSLLVVEGLRPIEPPSLTPMVDLELNGRKTSFVNI